MTVLDMREGRYFVLIRVSIIAAVLGCVIGCFTLLGEVSFQA
jgi:hypothetical protein